MSSRVFLRSLLCLLFSHTRHMNKSKHHVQSFEMKRNSKQANNFIIFRFPVDAFNNCRKKKSQHDFYILCGVKLNSAGCFAPSTRKVLLPISSHSVIVHNNIFFGGKYFALHCDENQNTSEKEKKHISSLRCVRKLRLAQKCYDENFRIYFSGCCLGDVT